MSLVGLALIVLGSWTVVSAWNHVATPPVPTPEILKIPVHMNKSLPASSNPFSNSPDSRLGRILLPLTTFSDGRNYFT